MTIRKLIVTRWSKGALDRVYVRTERGASVGYLDLKTSRSVIQREDLRDGFERAVQTWLERHGAIVQVAKPDASIAATAAGAAVREREAEMNSRHELLKFADGLMGEDRAASWRLGAEGEEATAKALAELPANWLVLHSIPVGSHGSDIDHLVVGPRGVVAINTKNHGNKPIRIKENDVTVGGSRVHHARNSRFEASRAGTILSQACGFEVKARGVVAFMGGGVITDLGQPRDGKVKMLALDALVPWLLAQPAELPPKWLAAIQDEARHARTWQTSKRLDVA